MGPGKPWHPVEQVRTDTPLTTQVFRLKAEGFQGHLQPSAYPPNQAPSLYPDREDKYGDTPLVEPPLHSKGGIIV